MKILIVEDEKNLLESMLKYLSGENYICEGTSGFQLAEDKIYVNEYDVFIIDIMLPDGNGLDLVSKVREKNSEAGIVIISAKNSLDDKIAGLNSGSDDYITKPFHLSELNARIKALLRRKYSKGSKILRENEISLDLDGFNASVNEENVGLTIKEFQLLHYLIVNKDRIVRKQSIVEHLWPDEYDFHSYDFLYTHVTNLRKKLTKKGCRDYINTVYGIGYKFSDEK
ncbi:MAG: response regulator transcription factor [Bacteroidales bacterium]|nr:response regulator transcription factor [Bacteroidales bacterium]MBN2820778.1 response regulator transcription factor [Bacteroidales bacterium]